MSGVNILIGTLDIGGNPYCKGGAEDTRVYLTESTHWKITNSTTMTFACFSEILKKDYDDIRKSIRQFLKGDIKSLFKNFPDFKQNDTRIAVFGSTTQKEALDQKQLWLLLDFMINHLCLMSLVKICLRLSIITLNLIPILEWISLLLAQQILL